MRLLMIDNYDSFTYNLTQLFSRFGLEILVHRHDQIGLAGIEALSPDWICISPGPKDPAHAGISLEVVRRFGGRMPILGVCLGMQVINEAFGGRTAHAPRPLHGKCSRVSHQGRGVFAGLPSPLAAARYHSLQCVDISPELEVTARSEDGVAMGLMHPKLRINGVQFHPESFMTEHGLALAENFLRQGSKALARPAA